MLIAAVVHRSYSTQRTSSYILEGYALDFIIWLLTNNMKRPKLKIIFFILVLYGRPKPVILKFSVSLCVRCAHHCIVTWTLRDCILSLT